MSHACTPPLSLSIANRADSKVVMRGAAELAKDADLVNKLAGAGRRARVGRPDDVSCTAAELEPASTLIDSRVAVVV